MDEQSIRRRIQSEETLKNESGDYFSKYYAVFHLQMLSETDPHIIVPDTISLLESLMKDPAHARKRQGFFLCRHTADTLASIISNGVDPDITRFAAKALKNVLATTNGHGHRTAAEALGALPVFVQGPEIPEIDSTRIPETDFGSILSHRGLNSEGAQFFLGRSLITPIKGDGFLVLKMARRDDSPDSLAREVRWMSYLANQEWTGADLYIPEPLSMGEALIFRLLPSDIFRGRKDLHPKKYAVGFIAKRAYFNYPNSPGSGLSVGGFADILFRNAFSLGKLGSVGIVHTAPIPLFHNRTQQTRRRDEGRYEWFRGGRLDRWLASCDYPNIGVTGIRDFEHLESFSGSAKELYRHMGSHFLSLLLVTGSYFRNLAPDLAGWDADRRPADARHLFDEAHLKKIIEGIFRYYYEGFTGTSFDVSLPIRTESLAARMIEEMGRDLNMEEILRVTDQKEMTETGFIEFLRERGYPEAEKMGPKKGKEDILIYSGPHLGAFNRPISLPEMIEAVETMAAICVWGRYSGNGASGSPKY